MIHAAIGGHVRTGEGYVAHHRAAADGDAKHIGPAHHRAGDGDHIITGDVHEFQPFYERWISIAINRLVRNNFFLVNLIVFELVSYSEN